MTAYNDSQFEPPAPIAYVTLRHQLTDASWSNVPMQLDTGADVTLVPQQAVHRLELTILTDTMYELEGFDGSKSQVASVELKMVFCRRTFRGKFLLIDKPFGIIGRDILNHVPILFNGPQLEWTEFRQC